LQQSSLKKKGITGFFWAFLDGFSGQLLSFVFSIAIARILLPEDYGVFALVLVVISLAGTLSTGGLGTSLIRRKKIGIVEGSTLYWASLLVGVVLYLALYLFKDVLASFFNSPSLGDILPVASLSLLLGPLGMVPNAILNRKLNFKATMLAKLPAIVVSGGVAWYMALKGYGLYALVVQLLIGNNLGSLLLMWKTKWYPRFAFEWRYFWFHWQFSYKLLLSGVMNTAFSNIYSILIGKFYPMADLGFYNRADSLKQLPVNNIYLAVSRVAYPILAEIRHKPERSKAAFTRILRLTLFVLAPILGVFHLSAEFLIELLLTEKWLPAVPFLRLLLISSLLYPLHALLLTVCNAAGRSDYFLKVEVIKQVLVLAGALFFIQYGISWLIYWQIAFSFFAVPINAYFSNKLGVTNSKDIALEILKIFICIGLPLLFVLYLESYLGSYERFWPLLVGCFLLLLLYFIFTRLINRPVLKEIQDYLPNLKKS